MKVLIVDDGPDDRRLLRYNLERHGCEEVIEARDGQEGFDLAKAHKPDLIISDALMPRADGFQLLRMIRKDEELRAIPFVFHSAVYTGSQDMELAHRLGAQAFIVKPKEPEELWAEVSGLLGAISKGSVEAPSPELMEEEREYLREYSRIVAAQLEAKVRELEESLAERRKAEVALRRLNRQLRAVSSCNRVLVRAVDEQALLNDICRIICDEAGYRLAWVGFAEHDATKTVRPAAWGGLDDGYVASARLSWAADAERAQGPGGAAIRSGETVYVQDLANDPRMVPWRESAARRDYRSTIALPLKGEDARVFGVLLIYSSEINAFSPEEIGLLEELAGELALGITVLRARVQRKEAERRIALMDFALNNVREAAFLIDERARFRYVNEEACRALGHSREELLALGVPEIAPDLPLARWPDQWRDLRSKGSLLFEGRYTAPDGRTIPVEINANYFEYQGQGYNLALARDITERKRAEAAQREGEERYRLVFENSPVSIWEEDLSGVKTLFDDLRREGVSDLDAYFAQHPATVRQCVSLVRIVDVNRAGLALHAAANKEELLAGLSRVFAPESLDAFRQELVCLWNGGTEMTTDAVVRTLAGERRNVTVCCSVCPGYEETLAKVLVSLTDITERKRAEQERLVHLRFVESLDQISRAVQATNNLEQMMSDVLDQVLSIFDCDRAWLVYPCDPEIASYHVPMERTRPEFPGAQAGGLEVPVDPETAVVLRAARASSGPVMFGPGSDPPLPRYLTEHFRVQSQIVMAVYPKVAKPYAFGMHQCSHPRVWQPEEARLFQEVGRRLGDALTSHLAHRELQESENRYRCITEGLTDYQYWVRVENGRAVETRQSPACATVTGYTPEECASDPYLWFRMVAPEDRGLVRERVQRTLAGMETAPLDHRILRKDGAVRWVCDTIILHKDSSGQLVSYDGVIKDVTERKRMELELQRLAAAIEQAAEAIVITDPRGAIEYVNPAFSRSTGYSRDEALGANPRILKSGCQDEAFYRELWDRLLSGETWHGRFVNRRKDGTFFEEDATISPVRGAQGETVHYVAVKRDVTAEVALEERLRQSQKMEAIGRLAGGVAHDFNNLLVVILGHADLLLEQTHPADPRRGRFQEIADAAHRAAGLTRQLLAFSRKQVLEPTVLDLGALVQGLAKMLPRLLGEDIDLRISNAPQVGKVRADVGQIEQVVLNLVINARDAMPGGGHVTIETTNVELDEEFARRHEGARAGSFVMLAVRDSGCGMAPEIQARIFEPFFTTKEQGKGTGLGLSTVYGVVKQSGGYIQVESVVGHGTTFSIYLPRVSEVAETADAELVKDMLPAASETILLVEDDPAVRRLAQEQLEAAGYSVLVASEGSEALTIAEEHQGAIDLLLTDVVMPGMTGADLAQQLGERRPETAVLFMSGYTDDAIARHGALSPGMALLTKPFTSSTLGRKVREVLGNRPSRSSTDVS